MPSSKHILASFNTSLEELRNAAVKMASITERNFTIAVQSLLDRQSDLAVNAIEDDEDVDNLEKQIDNEGVAIILRFTPMASDLRQVISTMKLSGDLERISDEAVSIARRAINLNKSREMEETHLIEKIYNDVLSLYRDAVRCYLNRDLDLAYTIKPRDKQIDKAYKQLTQDLLDRMADKPARINDFFDLTLVLRSLERIGDHATNIAEDAVYVESARDIRHADRFQRDAPDPDAPATDFTEQSPRE